MRTPFLNKQNGTSMIELIIASALLAVVGLGASAFFKRIGASDYEARAKSAAIGEMQSYLSAIERDFKLRDMSAAIDPICGTSFCSDFKANRMVRYTSGPDINKDTLMEIQYKTVCVSSSGTAVTSKLKNDLNFSKLNNYAAEAGGQSTALNGRCIKKLSCKDGQYPQIQIIPKAVANVKAPSYPRYNQSSGMAAFPNLSDKQSMATGVVGAALCGESAGGKADRLVLEAVYINSEGLLRLEKKEISMPRANVANIQMLPNNPFGTP